MNDIDMSRAPRFGSGIPSYIDDMYDIKLISHFDTVYIGYVVYLLYDPYVSTVSIAISNMKIFQTQRTQRPPSAPRSNVWRVCATPNLDDATPLGLAAWPSALTIPPPCRGSSPACCCLGQQFQIGHNFRHLFPHRASVPQLPCAHTGVQGPFPRSCVIVSGNLGSFASQDTLCCMFTSKDFSI